LSDPGKTEPKLIEYQQCVVVKLLSKTWWMPVGARLEGPKLEPEGPRAEMGLPTTDLGFSSIQLILFGCCGI